MTDEQKRAILQEIVELSGHRRVGPGDITILEYMEETGLSNATSRRQLMRLVDQGVLGTAMAVESERQIRVFWKIEP